MIIALIVDLNLQQHLQLVKSLKLALSLPTAFETVTVYRPLSDDPTLLMDIPPLDITFTLGFLLDVMISPSLRHTKVQGGLPLS